jgi:hypothetical protein
MCASPHETLNIPAVETANQWQRVYIAFANPAAGTSIISIGLKMIVDKTVDIYMDDILQSTTVVVDQTVLSVSGVGHPEETESFASQETDLLDGTIYQNTQYIRRVPIIRTGVVSVSDIQNLNDIWVSSDQEVLYQLDGVKVARGEDRLLVEWADGFKQARMVTMKFRERRVWSGRPTRWAYNLS